MQGFRNLTGTKWWCKLLAYNRKLGRIFQIWMENKCWPLRSLKAHRLHIIITGRMGWMAHRKWKEVKLQPETAGPGNILGCCLLSFHFLWAIHPIRPVHVHCASIHSVMKFCLNMKFRSPIPHVQVRCFADFVTDATFSSKPRVRIIAWMTLTKVTKYALATSSRIPDWAGLQYQLTGQWNITKNYWQNIATEWMTHIEYTVLSGYRDTLWNLNFSRTLAGITKWFWVTIEGYLSYLLPKFEDFVPTSLDSGAI